jgi:hypothetical protein
MKIKHSGTLPDETIRQILAVVEKMLRERDVEITLERGVRLWDNVETGLVEAAPTDGRTFTIAVNGGAVEHHETADARLLRTLLLRDT